MGKLLPEAFYALDWHQNELEFEIMALLFYSPVEFSLLQQHFCLPLDKF
jgi:hypothetical protein